MDSSKTKLDIMLDRVEKEPYSRVGIEVSHDGESYMRLVSASAVKRMLAETPEEAGNIESLQKSLKSEELYCQKVIKELEAERELNRALKETIVEKQQEIDKLKQLLSGR